MGKKVICKDPSSEGFGVGTLVGIAIFLSYAIGFPALS
jgi:hypothetical protein